jgi:Cdc6-like AAA superfamily ATPase
MITDARALRPEFVPRDLHHRDGQITHLSSCLDPATLGHPADDVLITGPVGAGKTTIAKYVLGQLEREALSVRWGYVDCMADSTRAAALFGLVRGAGLGADIQLEGMHASATLDRFRQCDDQIICVVDEVDLIDDPHTLSALFEVPNVSLMLVTAADENEWLADLDARIKSRLQTASRLRLERYSHSELVDILESRVEHGLVSPRVDGDALEHIADIAAGDARHGIAMLRRAARYVEEKETRELTPTVVEAIVDEAEMDLLQRRVRSLGTHKQLLYEIVRDAGEIAASELHDRYTERASDPRASSTRRSYLNSLERYELIVSDGTGSGTVYQSAMEPPANVSSFA